MMQKRLLTIMLLCITLFSYAQQISIDGNKFYVGENEIWLNGVNTPWDLWCDFGHPDFDYDWWDEEFASYEENHINLARVWIHCNGDISPNIDTTGYVSGVDDDFWDHMDYLFTVSKKYGVYVMPALLSFDITKDSYDNYQSWRNWLQDTDNIQSYIDNVLIPMIQRYEDEPYLLAWEICNEPEWMFENDEHGPQSFDDVQTMHAMFAAAIHENSERYVTTGSAAPKWNSPIYDSWGDNEGNMFSDSALTAAADNDNAYLDFYQYHWYSWQTEWMDSPWTMTTEEYEVDDRPVLVGESESYDVCDDFICMTVSEMYENGYLNGFDGVAAWKQTDDDYASVIVATNSFYNDHPDLVYPEGSRPTEVTGVTLSVSSISVEGNETYQLTATVEPSDATVPDVTWESASPTTASVSSEGIVTGITPGTTTITVTTLIGDYTANCTVEVTSSGSYGNCTDPVSVSLPYTYNGAGPGCYVTSGDITVVQSYSADLVELNGTDITNSYYTDIPSSIDGVYWIYYEGEEYGYLGIEGSGGDTSETVELTTSVTGEGSVTPSSGTYTLNSTLELTATAATGYEFSSWSGDTSATDNPITITMDSDKDIVANFIESEEEDSTYTLTITVVGEGTVSPESGKYEMGDTVTITASETDDNYVFSEWSGDISDTNLTATVIMDTNKSITATFVEIDSAYYTLTVSTEGEGSVEVTPSADSYLKGTTVTLTASADTGYAFESWTGDTSATDNPITITIDANISITANFADTTETECDFGTPIATALPSINSSYSYVHVIGSEGPDLSNVTNLTINWDLENDGLWQLSMITDDGEPDWWNNLLDYQTNTFSETQPAITLSNTGFTGLDGSYYVTLDDDNLVMDEQSGEYTIYFSNSSTVPCVSTKSTISNSLSDLESKIKVYPVPFTDELFIDLGSDNNVQRIQLYNTMGQLVIDKDATGLDGVIQMQLSLPASIYILKVRTSNESITRTIINE